MKGRRDVSGEGTEENRLLLAGSLLSWPGLRLCVLVPLLWVSPDTPSQAEPEGCNLSAAIAAAM